MIQVIINSRGKALRFYSTAGLAHIMHSYQQAKDYALRVAGIL